MSRLRAAAFLLLTSALCLQAAEPLLLPMTPVPAPLCTTVVHVRTLDDLAAACAVRGGDLTLQVHERILVPRRAGDQQWLLGSPGATVRIEAARPGAGFDFAPYVSTWPDRSDPNGLVLSGRAAEIRGLTLANYEGTGSAIKLNITGDVLVQDCHFEAISATCSAQLPDGSRRYAAVFGHVVGGRFVARGNTARRCCLSHEAWAHIYYITAAAIEVDDRWYDACGSAWDLIGATDAAPISARVGWARGACNVFDRRGQLSAPWLGVLGPGRGVWTVDELLGEWSYLWIVQPGALDPLRHVTRCDTSRAKLGANVAVWLNHGYYDAVQWRAAGFN